MYPTLSPKARALYEVLVDFVEKVSGVNTAP